MNNIPIKNVKSAYTVGFTMTYHQEPKLQFADLIKSLRKISFSYQLGAVTQIEASDEERVAMTVKESFFYCDNKQIGFTLTDKVQIRNIKLK